MMIATTKKMFPTFGPWQDYDTIGPRISERYFLSVRDLGLAPRKAFGAQKSRQFVLFSVKWAPKHPQWAQWAPKHQQWAPTGSKYVGG